MSDMVGDGVNQARPADADLVRSVFRAVPDAVLVVDSEGIVRMANDSAERLFGGVLIGMAVEELMPPGARHAHVHSRRGFLQKPRVRSMSDSPDIRGLRLTGEEFFAEISLSPVEVENQVWTVCAVRDITERRAMEKKLRDMSLKDSLTGLHNRRYLDVQLEHLSKGRQPIGAIVLDLDELKAANDTLGHKAGDQLIQSMAEKLRSVFRSGDIVCRVGGDEFAALLPGVTENELGAIGERLEHLASESQGSGQAPEFSFGVSWCEKPEKIRESLAEADTAMYRNKRARKWERQSSLNPSMSPSLQPAGEGSDDES